MSGNQARAVVRGRPGVTRSLAALAVTLLAILAALAGAAQARAASAAGQDVPGPQIAAALRASPLYVDPSLSSAFPPAARKALLAAVAKAPVPVYIVAVPMISGGQWSSAQQLADVVQDDLGKPGVYLTLDSAFGNIVDAYTWPSDPQGFDAPPYHASDAAQAVNLGQDAADLPAWQLFLQCVRLISSGRAVQAYNAALASAGAGGQAPAPSSGGGAAAGTAAATAAVAAAGAAAWLRGRRRRRRARRRQETLSAPPALAAAARAAAAADLHARAEEQLIALGELLEQPAPGPSAPGPAGDQAEADLARALDAYAAAAQVLDSASGVPDLAGVLVLAHAGHCAAAAAQARQAGRPVPPATVLCFFNPLHGEGARQLRWQAHGGQQALDVHACGDCADAAARHEAPAVLTDAAGGRDVPYYEAASVWASTGYGQFGSDLIRLVMAAGPRPGRG